MSYTTKQVIDALDTDLKTLSLPEHGTFLYADSRQLRYDVKPSWLQIFPVVSAHNILSTVGAYDNYLTVNIEWTRQTFNGVESNIDDQAVAETYLGVSDTIADRLRTYANGIPGLDNVTAEVSEIKWDLKAAPAWFANHFLVVNLFQGEC